MNRYLLTILLLSLNALADERSLLSGHVSKFNTSDDLEISHINLSYYENRRNIFWPYTAAEEDSLDLGVQANKFSGQYINESFESNHATLHLGKKWGFKEYSYLKFGGHQFQFDKLSSSIITYEIGHKFLLEKFKAHVFVNTDFYFIQAAIPAPIQEGLQRTTIQANMEYFLEKDWRFPFSIKSNQISDDNSALDLSVSAVYGKSYPVWYWVGYQVGQLQYQDRVVGYWSPQDFTAHGPIAEVSYPFSEYWQGNASGNFMFINEDDFEQGESHSYNIGLQFGKRDEFLINLSWSEIVSKQASNQWTSKGYLLKFEKSF